MGQGRTVVREEASLKWEISEQGLEEGERERESELWICVGEEWESHMQRPWGRSGPGAFKGGWSRVNSGRVGQER